MHLFQVPEPEMLWTNVAVPGDILRELFDSAPLMNVDDLGYLVTYPEEIPVQCEGKEIYFFGTIYSNPSANYCVPYLYKDPKSGKWVGAWKFLISYLGENCCVAMYREWDC
jgi:hypothetical protein